MPMMASGSCLRLGLISSSAQRGKKSSGRLRSWSGSARSSWLRRAVKSPRSTPRSWVCSVMSRKVLRRGSRRGWGGRRGKRGAGGGGKGGLGREVLGGGVGGGGEAVRRGVVDWAASG